MRSYILLIFVIGFAFQSLAQDAESQIDVFFDQVAGVMNSRDKNAINKFFQYYAIRDAKFIKQSFYVDPEDNEKIIDQETLNMNRTQYVNYLNNILSTPKRYAYEYAVVSTKYNQDSKSYIALVEIKESYSRTVYDPQINKNLDSVVFTASTCNFSLIYQNSSISITGMNCIEKIRKISVLDSE